VYFSAFRRISPSSFLVFSKATADRKSNFLRTEIGSAEISSSAPIYNVYPVYLDK